ncbi:hypothetical protein KAR34_03430 [bacterium]|nr:hypothetical protein [bacterium]
MVYPKHRMRALGMTILIAATLSITNAVSAASPKSLSELKKGAWQLVAEKISNGLGNEAYQLVEKIYSQAKKENDQRNMTTALFEMTRIKAGLYEFEKAVELLYTREFPQGKSWQGLLLMYRAHTLRQYYQMYRYDILQRKAKQEKTDFREWTAKQIWQACNTDFLAAWETRETLGEIALAEYSQYLDPGNFPETVRPTVRDFLTNTWADFLSDQETWTPEQSESLKAIQPKVLLAIGSAGRQVNSSETHPIEKMLALYADLQYWQKAQGRAEAVLDARIQPLLKIKAAFSQPAEIELVLQALQKLSPSSGSLSWWAYLQYWIAHLLEQQEKYIAAEKAARLGWQAYPAAIGGKLCDRIRREIQAPEFTVKSELHNPIGTGRINITHRNMDKVFIRVYALRQPFKHLNLHFQDKDIRKVLQTEKPLVQKIAALPDKRDYKRQSTFQTITLSQPGWYLVLASAKEEFSWTNNKIEYTPYIVSEIGVVVQRDIEQGAEIYCVSAVDGKPMPGVEVRFYRASWSQGRTRYQLSGKGLTNHQGIFIPKKTYSSSYRLVAKRGEHISLDPSVTYFYSPPDQYPRHLFVYTDRAIYRPEQSVKFKVLAVYANTKTNRYKIIAQKPLILRVADPNGETVTEVKVKTNAWGSASGSFKIPKGRLLGNYYISVDDYNIKRWGGNFQVEEYKIPKFKVAMTGPKQALRLDQLAVLGGKAEYYYGGPVRSAKVQYEITRQPVYPGWYWWYRPHFIPGQTEQIARGIVNTQEDGTFEIPFLPASVSSLKDEKDITFVFRIKASVTDVGGDTISHTASYTAGFVSLKADIQLPTGYPEAGRVFDLKVLLTDLDGQARSGTGRLTVYGLQAKAEHWPPLGVREKSMVIQATGPELAAMQRKSKMLQLDITHDQQGLGKCPGISLPVGAYLLEYKIRDSFGQEAIAKNFIQVAPQLGKTGMLPVSLTLAAQKSSVLVGDNARFLLSSGIPGQTVYFELQQAGKTFHRDVFSGLPANQITYPVVEKLRGGFTAKLFCVRGYRLYAQSVEITVPWDHKDLNIEFVHLRKVLAPGTQETITMKVSSQGDKPLKAEVLATMYDQSLDYFVKHSYPDIRSLFYQNQSTSKRWGNKFQSGRSVYMLWHSLPSVSQPTKPRFRPFNYQLGGDGLVAPSLGKSSRLFRNKAKRGSKLLAAAPAEFKEQPALGAPAAKQALESGSRDAVAPDFSMALRTKFVETAFFKPHIMVNKEGAASISFEVPDSVTAWNLKVYAHGRNMEAGHITETIQTKKDFMVRPYLPRFVREQDTLIIKTVIANHSDQALAGEAFVRLENEQGEVVNEKFHLEQSTRVWEAKPKESAVVSFKLQAPVGSGWYKVQVAAKSGNLTDGEERVLPVLPGRMHLLESKFAVLKDTVKKKLTLEQLKKSAADKSIVHQSLVVTVEGQLIYSVLKALPYLFQYPYACVEQTLNSFVCLALLHGTFEEYPTLAKMAKQFSERTTPLETWDEVDPNRKLALEETPWLVASRGGEERPVYINALDPRLVAKQKKQSLHKLKNAQKLDGSFSWFAGGPSSFYMTLYVLAGLARAESAGVEVDRNMPTKAMAYLSEHYEEYLRCPKNGSLEANVYLNVFLNYVLSEYNRPKYQSHLKIFKRDAMFKAAWQAWPKLSPYGRAMLAITLQRSKKTEAAQKILNSLLDIARTTENEGTYWAPEQKAWLWYNDTIETQAFILRAMLEIKPDDKRIDGMALWLLRNKQGNQWKSTRATAESIASLVAYMSRVGSQEVPGQVQVSVPPISKTVSWQPGEFAGKQRVIVPKDKISPPAGEIYLEKTGKGYSFISALWQYSTEKLPETGTGDVLAVHRKYYLVRTQGRKQKLVPIHNGTMVRIGDELEVELNITAKTPMEFIHLRDPRGAGFEPEEHLSGYCWEQLLGYYEEIRDSSTNFFFDRLPQGRYTFRYRIRAANEGEFRVNPAVIQSMYAPEFGAYSSGEQLEIKP